MNQVSWSKKEKAIARNAFDAAYKRECAGILAELRKRVEAANEGDDIWKINDYLWRKRREIEDKYDFRASVLVGVLARLVREGWITMDDLDGLGGDKQELLSRWSCFFNGGSNSGSGA